jgi:hypothetical protein
MAEYKTFNDWARAGRSVRRGQRAEFYLVNPETKVGLAAFSEDQTEPTADTADTADWDLVPAETYRANQQPKGGGPARVMVDLVDGTYSFWVGTAAKLNAAFKEGGYQWNPVRWRWQSSPRVKYDPTLMIKMIDESPDYQLFREGDLVDEGLRPAV